MTFRLLLQKHHNLLNQHLLRRVVERLRVFQEREQKRQDTYPCPAPKTIVLSPPAPKPVVLSPRELQLKHETKTEPRHRAQQAIIHPKLLIINKPELFAIAIVNLLTTQQLLEKIRPPNEDNLQKDQSLIPTKDIGSDFNDIHKAYDQKLITSNS